MLLAVAEHRHVESALIPRIATGLCSGMARTGGMCGAVSGGILAVGLVLGRSSPEQPVDPCYAAAREFMARFAARFGSLNCAELTGVQLGTYKGQTEFRARGLMKECANYVAESGILLAEILENHP